MKTRQILRPDSAAITGSKKRKMPVEIDDSRAEEAADGRGDEESTPLSSVSVSSSLRFDLRFLGPDVPSARSGAFARASVV